MRAKKHSFTLVELLGVMSLIAILAALGFSGYSYAMTTAKDKSTRATIKRLEAGLEAIKTKQGHYPTTEGKFKRIIIMENAVGDLTVVNFMEDSKSKVQQGNKKTNNYPDYSVSATTKTDREKATRAFLETISFDTLKNSIDPSTYYLLDAWGNPIYYCHPAKLHSGGVDLISAGPDGKFGKDNKNDPKDANTMDQYRNKKDGSPLCDDVLND